MSILTDQAETDLLELIFLATTWLSLAEDKVTGPYTQLHISLHTGDPGEAGVPDDERVRLHRLRARGGVAKRHGMDRRQ